MPPFMRAQVVADFITIGLYNTNMERHAYPFLPQQPEGLEALKLSHQLQVADVMTPKIVAMPVVIRCVGVDVCSTGGVVTSFKWQM